MRTLRGRLFEPQIDLFWGSKFKGMKKSAGERKVGDFRGAKVPPCGSREVLF